MSEALLARDKAEALAELEQEISQPLEDGLLKIPLLPDGLLLEVEKLGM